MYTAGVTIRFVPHKSIAKYSPAESGTPSTALFINAVTAAYKIYRSTLFTLIFNFISLILQYKYIKNLSYNK